MGDNQAEGPDWACHNAFSGEILFHLDGLLFTSFHSAQKYLIHNCGFEPKQASEYLTLLAAEVGEWCVDVA